MSLTFILYIYLIKASTSNNRQAHILFPTTQVSTGTSASGEEGLEEERLWGFFLLPSPGRNSPSVGDREQGWREAAEGTR